MATGRELPWRRRGEECASQTETVGSRPAAQGKPDSKEAWQGNGRLLT